jgi:RNA polymerase sigma factor (sigma-70 family)
VSVLSQFGLISTVNENDSGATMLGRAYWHAFSWSDTLAGMDFAAPPSSSRTATAANDAPVVEAIADEELMLQYQAGDASAFDVLYARHRATLFRFIARQMNARSETEELFQEVWMNVIQSRADYVPNAKFRTWLFTLAHHRLMDFFRKHRRVAWVAFDANAEAHDDGVSAAPVDTLAANRTEEPDVKAESREQAAAILKLIEALPAPQREAFLLSEEGGLSVPEIARITGVSLEAAKSRLRYALAKLREGLKEFR